jgi:hypothetical protein
VFVFVCEIQNFPLSDVDALLYTTSMPLLLLSLALLACICVPSNWPSAFYRFRVAATSNIRLIFVAMCRELGYDKIEVDVLWV